MTGVQGPNRMFACTACGHRARTLWDRCPECLAFGSFGEAAPTTASQVASMRARPPSRLPASLSHVSLHRHPRRPTGLGELDRVLGQGPNGEGLAAGQVLVLGGSPGVGKSTLLMQALDGLTAAGGRALYASGEETREQIADRAHRLGLTEALTRIDVLDTHQVEDVDAALRAGGYATAVVDSLQTFTADDLGDPGTTRTVAVVAERLTSTAKSLDVSLWLVGQATKDGRLAGPNAAAHVVDTLLWFEREHGADFRVLRAGKNRFGSVGEVGLFRMDAAGLHDVADPSGPLVRSRAGGSPVGAVWAAVADADRPVLVEVQALVGAAADSSPKRVAVGLDAQRLALVMAVLGRHAGVELEGDVFLDVQSPTGRLSDRGLDLPIALALASAARCSPVPADFACCGKLSLTGEVVPPVRLDARLSEMRRLGFGRLLVPFGGGAKGSDGATEVATLDEAIALALGGGA